MEKFRGESVESTANYEGNDALLLFERVKDPAIYEQILDLLYLGEQSERGDMRPIVTPEGRLKRDGEGNVVERPYEPKSREQLQKELDEAIERAETSTDFKRPDNPYESPNSHEMMIGTLAPWNNKPLSEKQMSIAEAHEKGHVIRPYDTDFHREYFRSAFRFNAKDITEEDLAVFKSALSEEDLEESDDSIRDMYVHYLTSGMEVAERMSQLKNYFGMSGADEFTREHLNYARKNYLKDTGLNNGMNVFFKAITEESEEEFLRLINSAGI